MRIKTLIISEFRFLWKYGLIALYSIFTLIYLCLLCAVPISVRNTAGTFLIFTDPAAMGLFFMGAVILLEKSQRVESSLGVSPITISEYIAAKIIPMMVVGCFVSAVLCIYAKANILLCIIGVSLSSILFSLCGLMIAANIKSLNSFMIATIPFEIILFIPPILYLFGAINSYIWLVHPGVAAISLISGKTELHHFAVFSIAIWILPVFLQCKRAVKKSFTCMGGAKL